MNFWSYYATIMHAYQLKMYFLTLASVGTSLCPIDSGPKLFSLLSDSSDSA